LFWLSYEKCDFAGFGGFGANWVVVEPGWSLIRDIGYCLRRCELLLIYKTRCRSLATRLAFFRLTLLDLAFSIKVDLSFLSISLQIWFKA
jgi:hypothetical protein